MVGRAQDASAPADPAPADGFFRSPRLIAIGGGRDVCGKSLTSAGLALAFAKRGQRVILVDCAKGYQAQSELLDISLPPIEQVKNTQGPLSLRKFIFPTAVERLKLLPAYSHFLSAGGLSTMSSEEFVRKLRYLPTDIVILDTGHGEHDHECDFFNNSDQRIVVTTSQFLSIQFGFSFVKKTIHRLIQTSAATKEEIDAWQTVSTKVGADSTVNLLKAIAAVSPAWLKNVQKRFQNYHAHLIGNLLMEEREENVLHAVARMIKHHVKLNVPVTGSIKANLQVYHASAKDQPLLRISQEPKHQSTVDGIITQLLGEDVVLPELPRDPNAEFLDMFGDGADFEDDPSLRQATRIENVDEDTKPTKISGADALADPNAPVEEAVSFSSYQRKKERLAIKMSAEVHWLGEKHVGEVLELSETGASIDVNVTLQENSRVDVYFESEPEERYLLEVRNVRSDSVYGFEIVGAAIAAPKLAAWHAVFPR